MKITDDSLLEKQNIQIGPELKLRYFIFLILTPVIVTVIILSKNLMITIAAVVFLLWLSRPLLDLPGQHLRIKTLSIFKPITTFKAFKKLFQPNEYDISVIPKLNLIFSVAVPFYIFSRLIQYLITIVLIVIIIYRLFFT